MSDRTLDAHPGPALSVRKPSYEQQKAAMTAGYSSVRDWVLDQVVQELHALRARVAQLEDTGEVVDARD